MLKIILVFIVFFLSSCSSLSSYKLIGVEREKLNLERPEKIVALPVQVVVITKENQKEVFSEMEKQKKEPVLFGMDSLSYKNLSLNIKDILNYMQIQNQIIESYKKYYEKE